MTNYYYVAASLPRLKIDEPPDMDFHQLMVLLHENLSPRDFEKVRAIRRYIDMTNMVLLWRGEELDIRGNFIEGNDLEEAFLTGEGFPDYVYDFLREHEKNDERLRYHPQLMNRYFSEECQSSSGFLKEYFRFEREWRLVLLGFRAKKLGRDIATELRYEDPSDDIVAQIMAQKDSKVFEPPYGFEELREIFVEKQDLPMELYQALESYRFKRVGELVEMEIFSLDKILAFTVELLIVENWHRLGEVRGSEIVGKIVKEVS